MKKPSYDELAAHQTRESIVIRMQSFKDEFERLARTAREVSLVDQFKGAIHAEDIATVPWIAADLEPLAEWMKGYGDGFEELAQTPEQKNLAGSFRKFIDEITSPEVRDVFQRPLLNELVEEIKGAMANGSSNGVPFGRLLKEGKEEFLSVVIDWTDYINRGLIVCVGDEKTCESIHRIIENAIAGKPSERWIGQSPPLTRGVEKMSSGQQRLEKLTMTELKEATQKMPKENTRSSSAGRSKDKGIER